MDSLICSRRARPTSCPLDPGSPSTRTTVTELTASPLAESAHERFEEGLLARILCRGVLRVPLHTEHPAGLPLDGLNESILGPRGGDQPRARPIDPLVMVRRA